MAYYDRRTGKTIKHWSPICQFSVKAVAFHPGGRHFACGSLDGRGQANLFLIDTTTGEILHKIAADPKGVTAVCFSPGGSQLAAFGASGTVTIWDATKLLKLERD